MKKIINITLPYLAICIQQILSLPTSYAAELPISYEQLKSKGSASIKFEGKAVHLHFDDPGWDSGVQILPPASQSCWDLSKGQTLAADITNLSPDRQLRLTMHIASGERSDKSYREVNSGIALNPGEMRTVKLRIPHKALYSTPDGVPGPKVLDTAHIKWIEFYMQWPFEGKQPGLVNALIANLRTEGTTADATEIADDSFFPFIDEFGQYVHDNWQAKIKSAADLQKLLVMEKNILDKSERPVSWNRFGGWADGPQLKATGSFRTEKYKGKWYFVDPDGRLFFSFGMDVLQAHTDATRTAKHEKWFQGEIPDSGVIDFNHRNLQLKYADKDYEDKFYRTLTKRLEHWGFNTVGNWGNASLMAIGRTPYTLQLTDYNYKWPQIKGSKLKFYDVFDPVYIDGMKNLFDNAAKRNSQVAESINDPFCIGYFIDNELNFGNRGRQILGDDVMRSPADQPSKREFVNDLKTKYQTINKLNNAWESEYAGWDELLKNTEVPGGSAYKADSDIFFSKVVDQYFRLCHEAVKSHAPEKLYLGCRFISTDAVRRAFFEPCRKYCDVITVNIYSHSPANFGAEGFPDMPVLIGEFHFGIFDRGMFSAGLCPAGITEEERATAFTRFLQGALVHPNIIGAHWFQFRDQPLTGRWDGEGYEIGFADVADTPYVKMTRASRKVGENMYYYRERGLLNNSMQ